jgi:membrane fusion protein (multidrug efflux system)
VEALFPNPGNGLRPGEFARVRVKFDLKHDSLLVPQRAVSELQGSYQVAVIGSVNQIHIQPVRVGDRSGNLWIIEEGLHPGQRVVVEGIQKVREGMTVATTNFVPDQLVQTSPGPPKK